jgi:hypothetical protein
MAGFRLSFVSHALDPSRLVTSVMHNLLRPLDRVALPIVDFLLAVAGQRRVRLGDWPNANAVEAALSTLKEFGAENLGASPVNLPVDIENLYFRVRGRRVRLWVEQFGDVTLWGPSTFVIELAERVAEKLAAQKA